MTHRRRPVVACLMLAALAAVPRPARAAPADVDGRVDAIVSKLSAGDKVRMLSGVDGFYTAAGPSAGVPRFKFTDGPVGTRNDGPSTAYPAGVLLAATWDPALAEREGTALGRDARSRGDHVILGPGVNVCREPQNGRNFEYFGEDPLLAARLAAAYVRGVQGQGVAACVKHFACNNQETDRMTIDARVSERALHEIYLPAFEAAIHDGGCRTIMASYNRINGHYATANRYLLTTVLRDQWHFDGLVMSDWGAVHDVTGPMDAGLDLEMPGGDFLTPAKLDPLIRSGRIKAESVDLKVRRLVRVAVQMGWLDRPQKDPSIPADDAANDAVALDVAREGITLLKNDGGVLPLDRAKVKRVVVLGPDTDRYVGGGGSSYTTPARPVTLLAGLRAAAPGVTFDAVPFRGTSAGAMSDLARASTFEGGSLMASYYAGTTLTGTPRVARQDRFVDFDWKGGPAPELGHDNFSARWTGTIKPTTTGRYRFACRSDDGSRVLLDGKVLVDNWGDHATRTATGEVDLTAGHRYAVTVEYFQGGGDAVMQFGYGPVTSPLSDADRQAIASADAVVVLAHTEESEGSDRPYDLPTEQTDLIAAAAAANPHTVVVLESGGNVGMAGWVDRVPGLVQAWFPGQAGGRALGEVVFGDTDPSGHLPDTFGADAAADVAVGSGPAHYPGEHGRVDYAEGIYVGYRGYDHRGVKPRFPFGFGLSYTSFDLTNLRVTPAGAGDGRTFTAAVDVTNSGRVAGSTVAQLYVRPPTGGSVERPPQELKGFTRLTLQPGQTATATMTLDGRSFAHWDEATHDWQVVPGTYRVGVGRDSRDVPCTATVTVK